MKLITDGGRFAERIICLQVWTNLLLQCDFIFCAQNTENMWDYISAGNELSKTKPSSGLFAQIDLNYCDFELCARFSVHLAHDNGLPFLDVVYERFLW